MKTVIEFIQRLHNDPEFEHKAQAYENRDEFMQFVKDEGYDFTLDQLLKEFGNETESSDLSMDDSPEPLKTVEEFIQRLQDDPEFERKAQAYENTDEFMEFVKSEGYDFTLDQLTTKFKHEKDPDRRLAPVKIVGTILQPPDESESERPAKSSPPSETDSPKQPETMRPKLKGNIGGRRRGMKWENFDS